MKKNSLLIMIYMEKRKEIQIENLQEQPIQSTLGLCYPIPSDLVLFSPLRFYSVVPKKKKGSIWSYSVHFGLVQSYLLNFGRIKSTSVLFNPLGLLRSYLVHFGPILSTFILFCSLRSIQFYLVQFGLLQTIQSIFVHLGKYRFGL